MRILPCSALFVMATFFGCGYKGSGSQAGSPGVVPGENLPIPPAFTGVFGLQAMTQFDCLDGVAFDPVQGTVSLFGHQGRKDRLHPIAYLDHLATAMECQSPTIDLHWAPGSEREIDRALNVDDNYLIDRLGSLYDREGRLLPLGAWWFQLGGANAKAGMTRFQVYAAVLSAIGRKDDAAALSALEEYEKALARGKQDEAQAYFELLCKLLGISDDIADYVRKHDARQITKQQLLDATLPLFVGASARLFGQDPRTYQDQYFSHRRNGVDPERAMEKALAVIASPEIQKRFSRQVIFVELFRNLAEVHIPPAHAHQILGMTPRVSVDFSNLPPRSRMARVAFEADVFGKFLMVMPELKNRIPRYRTFFEWRRTAGGAATDKEGHLWFSPDGFELNESADGTVLQFGRTPVRINLHRKVSGRSVLDPVLKQYADELTGLYDDIAQEYPILQELRECMKMVAVAEWLKKRNVRLSLPAEGRILWNPPREIPGIVQIVIAVKEGPVGMMLWALGGVDFDGRYTSGSGPGWRFQKSADAVLLPRENMVISPIEKSDQQIREITKRIKHIEVPPPGTPMRSDAGWCGKAEVGKKDRERVLSYMTIRTQGLDRKIDYPAVTHQLEKVLQKAKWIEHCDKMINARTKARVDAMSDLETLKKESDGRFKGIYDEFYALLSAATIEANSERVNATGGAAFAEKRKLDDHIQRLDKARGLLTDAKDGLEAWRTRKFDGEYGLQLMEKFSQLGIEIGRFGLEARDFWVAQEVAANVGRGLMFGFTLLRVENKAFEIADIQRMRSEINDSLGQQATSSQQLQKSCKDRVDDFEREFRKLREMVEGK